ncbi:MAG TPA: WYL domain-containing protein [Leptospiraceae bacterium]|nr:WYL domain-containing protein [Leptospiraceae bacterium]
MEYVTFRISLDRKFLNHFRHVYFPEFSIVQEEENSVILDVKTWDYRYFYNAVFNYRNHCKIISPKDKKDFFKEVLKKTLKVYETD